MSSHRFSVDPAAVLGLAAAFERQAAHLHDAVGPFRERARDVQAAFGLLGPSEQLYWEYQGVVADAALAFEGLATTLAGMAANLEVTAENYAGADRSSTTGP